jgi:hypothetical protein
MNRALAVAAALLLAGCSAPATPTVTVTAAAPTPSVASITPSPSPSRDLSHLEVGEHITMADDDGGLGTLALVEVKYTKSPYRDPPLYAAKVKACATERKMTVSSTGWLVETADGEPYDSADDQGEGDPTPMYPLFDRSVPKGRCIQGWIPFEIKKGVKITSVGYAVSEEQTVYWSVA